MILKQEVSLIKNPQLREAVKKCIRDRARKLKLLPASTYGKYHPPDERGPGGLIRHIKRVVWFVKTLKKALELSDEEHDCHVVAALLHDISNVDISTIDEEGTIQRDRDKYKIHPKLSAQIAMKYIHREGIDFEDPRLIMILDIIRSHMGPWFANEKNNCKPPRSKLEILFYTADYIASRSSVKIDIEGEL